MKEEKQAEKRTMTITSLVIESSVAMTGVEDTNPLRSSAMNMAEPPTFGRTIVLPSLEDGLEPELEQTKLPPLLSALSPSFQPPPTTTTAAVAADIDIETNERPSYTHHRSRYGAYECQAAVVYHYRCLSVWDHLHRQRLPFAAAAVAATPLGTSPENVSGRGSCPESICVQGTGTATIEGSGWLSREGGGDEGDVMLIRRTGKRRHKRNT